MLSSRTAPVILAPTPTLPTPPPSPPPAPPGDGDAGRVSPPPAPDFSDGTPAPGDPVGGLAG
eukprot:2456216-Prymnesium_polylepis.1